MKTYDELSDRQKIIIDLFKQWIDSLPENAIKYNNTYYNYDWHFGSIKNVFCVLCMIHRLPYDEKANLLHFAEENNFFIVNKK